MSEGNAVGRFEFALSWMTGKDKNIENAKEWLEKALDVVDGEDIVEKQDMINKLWLKLDSSSGLLEDERNELSSIFATFIAERDVKTSALEDSELAKNFFAHLELARKGDSEKQLDLGKLYYYGLEGVLEDKKLAVYWYQKSANQGNEFAQYRLGECYRLGHGVDKDVDAAKEWYQRAASQGLKVAIEKLEELA